MSQETSQWLNQNVLIGYTEKRGQAWHYRASEQGDEPNHYTGAIPVEDVHRRLFNWKPLEGTLTSIYKDLDGKKIQRNDPSRKTIVRSDTGDVLGVFRKGYQIHEYGQWLIKNVETLLDAHVAIGSAGLLKGGAVAWVQVEMEDTLNVEGVEFRPFLTAATSLDGSLASTYSTGAQVVVCDNTLSAALSDKTAASFRIKHSANSLKRIGEVRDALGIIHSTADAFAEEVAALTATTVSDEQWDRFLDEIAPLGESARAQTMAEKKRDALNELWTKDERVAPWNGTAWGALSAVNTYTHHVAGVRGAVRAERNMERAVTGWYDWLDKTTLDSLHLVLAA